MISTNYAPGTPIWTDLGTPDIDGAAAFYRAVLGWEFQSYGPDAGGYGVLTKDGKTAAALGPLMGEGGQPSWTVYFHTQDANATAESVTEAGGAVRAEPFDVFTQGRMAQFADPAGAAFAVWQPGNTKGLDVVNEPGSLSWTELHTSDPGTAVSFYREVFGWVTQELPMGDVTYTLIQPRGGGESSSQGGIMPLSAGMGATGTGPVWLPYFEVADCDAAVAPAAEHGGTVIAPPMDVPQAGRLATLADPAGAVFCVVKSAPM
jgi:predicted enzyme related to lactoylglutathione lyase